MIRKLINNLMPVILIIYTSTAFAETAQKLQISSSPNPVGSGARALGMGGAFISIADDATAASWNPACLIQLQEPEICFVRETFYRYENNKFNLETSSGYQHTNEQNLNFFSATYPFPFLGHNMAVSINYQKLYDFNREWKFPVQSNTSRSIQNSNIHYQQNGKLSAVGLAYSTEISQSTLPSLITTLSFGISFNFWLNGINNKWEEINNQQSTGIKGGQFFMSESQYKDEYLLNTSYTVNVGVLFQLVDRLSLGMNYKTGLRADIEHKSFSKNTTFRNNDPDSYSTYLSEEKKLKMPESYGIGLAYMDKNRKWCVALDLYRTEWHDFVIKNSHDIEISPITGRNVEQSSIEDTTQIRLGFEYDYMPKKYQPHYCFRLGFFYDPLPAPNNNDDIFGVSIGLGYNTSLFSIDTAYQYRSGRNVGSYLIDNMNFSQDIKEHMIYYSCIFYIQPIIKQLKK